MICVDTQQIVEDYNSGLGIREVAEKHNISYETTRQILKTAKVQWRRKYVSDFSAAEIQEIIGRFDTGQSVKEIALANNISGPAISRLLIANNRTPDASCKRYEILRGVPFTKAHREIIVGTILGDGCLYRDGPNGMFKLKFSHKEKHQEYFHWKIAMMDPFINGFYKTVDKRGNSIMLETTTICHSGFAEFANMFYDASRIKHVPKDVDKYLSPLGLAIWIMDDGNLNEKVNLRLATQSFTQEENILLQDKLKAVFDLRSKVYGYEQKGKQYWAISFNKENTQKLSDIVRPYIVNCMKYKIMPEDK